MRQTYAPVESYTGNNAVAEYGFDFKIESAEQLMIVVLDTTPEVVQRVRGDALSAFFDSIEFDGDEGGGSVTLAANLPTGYKIFLLQANDEPTQPQRFREKNTFTLKLFESTMDFFVGALQRTSWLSQRSIRIHDAQEGDFEMQLPLNPEEDATLIFGPDGMSVVLGPTVAQLLQASADALAAGVSAAAASASQTAAAASATAASGSETAAAASAAGSAASLAAALAAQAAAEAALAAAEAAQTAAENALDAAIVTIIGALGFVSSGPFAVAAAADEDLTGETIDEAIYRQVDFIAVVSGDTDAGLRSRFEFSFVWNGTAWVKLDGPERHLTTIADVAFTVADGATGQLNAENLGADDVEIILQKIYHSA